MSRLTSAFAGFVVLAALAGCAGEAKPGAHPSPLVASMSAEQAAAVADGVATYDEYTAGFGRFSSCLSASGYDLEITDEANEVIAYRIPDDAVSDGSEQRCYDAEFAQLDMLWQVARQDTSADAARLRECLAGNGVDPADTWDEMVEQAEQNSIDLLECLAEE